MPAVISERQSLEAVIEQARALHSFSADQPEWASLTELQLHSYLYEAALKQGLTSVEWRMLLDSVRVPGQSLKALIAAHG